MIERKSNPNLSELFGHYRISPDAGDNEISIGDNKILLHITKSSVLYKRLSGSDPKAQATIFSDKDPVVVGIFPIPPIFTPRPIARNLYLRFDYPVVVDQRSETVVYAKMPIEIGVFRQSEDEELLIDAFSPRPQKYALYGNPESGVVCRYADSEAVDSKEGLSLEKYQEALVRVRIRNDIDNIVKVSKVIIPMDDVILDHAHDEAWLTGSVEMALDSAFGKDIVSVRLVDAKVKKPDKTSLIKSEETLTFRMDAGY
jgi:hypothetical protein